MGKIYLENDHSIKKLLPITFGRETHKISKGSSLFLKQTPTSMRFIWRPKGKDIPLGVWNNNTHEMLVQVKKAKQWVKTNPDNNPANISTMQGDSKPNNAISNQIIVGDQLGMPEEVQNRITFADFRKQSGEFKY